MSPIEIAAVALGLINVVLIIRRNVWNYPFGLVMVALYAKVFFDARLYANASLQIFFFVVQVYGWVVWLRHRDDHGHVVVVSMRQTQRLLSGLPALLLIAILGWWFSAHTDDPAAWADATIAALSIVAQTLLSLRYVESWAFWIGADLIAVGLFATQRLYLSAGLYVVLLCISVAGAIEWSRVVHRRTDQGLAA